MATFSILDTLTDANLTIILQKLSDAGVLMPFLALLPLEDKKRIYKMGTKLEGFVSVIDQAAVAFPDAIPASNPYDVFKSRIVLYEQLTHVSSATGSMHQLVEDTRVKLGSEILLTANIYYSSFKKLSKNDVAMAETLASIASFYTRKPAAQPVVHTIAATGSLFIKNVATNRQLVNKGVAVVSFKPSHELTQFAGVAPIVVDPSSSATVPKGWTSIDITNVSQTQAATISVRMK